jgi:hypothetical protein
VTIPSSFSLNLLYVDAGTPLSFLVFGSPSPLRLVCLQMDPSSASQVFDAVGGHVGLLQQVVAASRAGISGHALFFLSLFRL